MNFAHSNSIMLTYTCIIYKSFSSPILNHQNEVCLQSKWSSLSPNGENLNRGLFSTTFVVQSRKRLTAISGNVRSAFTWTLLGLRLFLRQIFNYRTCHLEVGSLVSITTFQEFIFDDLGLSEYELPLYNKSFVSCLCCFQL